MTKKMSAGDLRDNFIFELVVDVPDGNGGFEKVVTELSRRGNIRFLRGGETVQASRLQGKQPVVVTVRNSQKTRQITTDTIMRDARTGTAYNIRAVVPTDDRQFIEITAESGVAV